MPAIYLCDVVGTGTSRDPFTPDRRLWPPPTGAACILMIDDGPKKKACVWCETAVVVSGAGIILIQSAPTKDELIAKLQATNLSNPQRNVVNNWLTASGYTTIPAGTTSQYDAVLFVCRQVNPTVDLSVLIA